MSALARTSPEPELRPVDPPRAASPEDLETWLETATPGVPIVYAVGAYLPVDAPGVQLVTRWIEEGRVVTSKKPDQRNRARWNYRVAKASDPAAAEPAPGGRKHPPRAVNREALRAMLDLLRKHAERGLPCPTNRELGRMLALKHRHAGRYLFNRLVDEGKIRVDDPRATPRVVTIVRTGKQTASGEGK